MTIYLSNADVRPTGFEAGEFLDSPSFAMAPEPELETPEVDDEDDDEDGDGAPSRA
jgi:hypothetical protein